MSVVVLPLNQGKSLRIDEEDLSLISQHHWRAVEIGRTFYAHAKLAGRTIYAHRIIMDAKPRERIDHQDHDGLNCVRSNMRHSTPSQNNSNQLRRSDNTSGYKGVYWSKVRGAWMAYINHEGKRFNLGYYDDPIYAARVYDMAARKYHGEFALLNFPNESVEVEMSTGKRRKDNQSGYRGVSKNKRGKWVAQLTVAGESVHASFHPTAEEAARTYDAAALHHLGSDAKLNFPTPIS